MPVSGMPTADGLPPRRDRGGGLLTPDPQSSSLTHFLATCMISPHVQKDPDRSLNRNSVNEVLGRAYSLLLVLVFHIRSNPHEDYRILRSKNTSISNSIFKHVPH